MNTTSANADDTTDDASAASIVQQQHTQMRTLLKSLQQSRSRITTPAFARGLLTRSLFVV